jgi:hypothetical protein
LNNGTCQILSEAFFWEMKRCNIIEAEHGSFDPRDR